MAVPVLVFLICFGVGVVAAARWLPELAVGPVGGLAFFVVCGLLAAALSIAGLHAYSIYEALHSPGTRLVDHGEIMAGGLRNILFDSGTLVALAGIVYLLAPGIEEERWDTPPREPEAANG